ncbi:GNAT family N-acetyltransferase [Cohnella lupini]|uniref:Ribosomal protein S18 acetylase RimI-like enzyme n=1 Tax=Cohnella lupini TaxID=1294267 RepID=A0A3D9I887_9BACL|nr:ribosomal protein S18 acetylase RimI-like enzyme [Cohnella lupini]
MITQRLNDIERLQTICEAHDHVQLKLNREMLRKRESSELDFFHYENGELIAFLGLYPFGSTVEICGMTSPNERRKGHFQRLFEQGISAVRQAGFKKILLNAPAGSDAAKAFLSKQSAVYAFSEHQMKWQQRPIEDADGVILRPARADDFEMRVRLSVTAFGLDEEDARAIEGGVDVDEDTDMHMIEVNEETIGKIRVSRVDGQAWIYGFSILPQHQGKGIGRKVLRQVVKEQSSNGHSVHLEVETKNDQALGLYESVGFQRVHSQDYYRYE